MAEHGINEVLSIENNTTDTQKAPLDKFLFKDLSKSFNQITIDGFDSATGLDVNGCTFEEALKKSDTSPTCIKFIDTKQITGDILPKELVDLPQIEAIDISECGVREIPQILLQMTQLHVLKASDNHISSLPEHWQQLDLTALDISKNVICKLDPSIQSLKNLQILAIAHCNLKDFPYNALGLKFLKALILDGNPICYIEPTKDRLCNLQTLSLKSCLLTEVPQWLTANLQHFDIGNNSIQTFPSCLSDNIVVLKLGSNQLDVIPDEISRLQNLEVLDVSSCGLKEFPNVVLTLTKLQSLNVKDNYIHAIPHDITKLDLKELFIGENPLDEFPNFLDEFVNLNVIDLSSCLLETFPFDFRKLTNLREITANDNYIKEIPEDISQIKLQKLLMKGNPVKQLPESFENLQDLEELDLSSSGLKIIPRQILGLNNLECLSMRNNAMEILPPDWDKCVNLTNLDLSENLLHQLPSSISQLLKLEALTLEYCCFAEFPNVLLEMQSLKSLNFAQNQLSTLPREFGHLHLTRLVLRDNLIQQLPVSFHYLTRLQCLDLSSCRLKEFPSVILELKNLEHLLLNDNKISALPTSWKNLDIFTLNLNDNPLHEALDESLCQLKSLVSLSLGNCLLAKIPSWFSTFERMTRLNISGNNITSSGISALPPSLTDFNSRGNPLEIIPESIGYELNLTNLSFNNCELTELPPFVGNLKRLQALDIGRNGLKYLPNVLKDLALHTLSVEMNPIETLDMLEDLTTLRNLDVSGCRLETFPKVVMSMPKLTELQLDFNAIRSLPGDLMHPCLTKMSVSCNPIKTLPPSIAQLKNLHELDITGTEMNEFPRTLLDMHNLIKLKLNEKDFNASLQLPADWKNLRTLRQLSIQKNFNTTSLGSLLNLVDLDISSKELLAVDAIRSKFVKKLRLSFYRHSEYDELPAIHNVGCPVISLDLLGNKMSHIPDSLAELTSLEILRIVHCRVKEFPETLNKCLLKLKILHIGRNSFLPLPRIWYCKRLSDIDLSETPEDSSLSLSQLACLTRVNLSHCRLTTFPSVVLQLQKLKDLNIQKNHIKVLPLDWNNLELKYLNIQDNSLACGWPLDSLGQLSKLEDLNISGNSLKEVPEVIPQMKYLRRLDISNNPVRKFPDCMGSLFNLVSFRGSGCGLQEFTSFLTHLRKVKTVVLESNRIQIIPGNWNPVYLEHLSLNNNPLKLSSETLLNTRSIYNLEMVSCQLKELPELVLTTPILMKVDIQTNFVTKLSKEGYRIIQRIPEVELSPGLLEQPPKNIYEAGPESVFQYYKDLELTESCNVGFHNVVLLGSINAGKTSLVQSLVSGQSVLTTQEDRTIVVDEDTWKVTENLHFHIIDFGGHDVYEFVYPIFLKDRKASIVIAVDLSTISVENSAQNLFKWLHTVLSVTGESSEVIVVGTKSDLCDDETDNICLLERFINDWKRKCLEHADAILRLKHFPSDNLSHVKHFKKMVVREIRPLITSSASMDGFDKLKTILLNQSREMAATLPGSWFALFKSLSELQIQPLSKGYLSMEQLELLCPGSMTPQSVSVCLKYLHHRGMVLWYENDSKLRDYVIYDVTLCIEILKPLFSHDLETELGKLDQRFFRTLTDQKHALETFLKTGFISDNLLKFIWRNITESEVIYNLAVTLLKLFNLCYEEETKTADETVAQPSSSNVPPRLLYFPWFVRKVMDQKEMSKFWPVQLPQGTIPLKCVFTFQHRIPTSLYEQFSVQLQTQLTKGHRRQDWKNSIHIIQNAVHILIQKKEDFKQDYAHLIIQMRAKLDKASQMYKLCVSVVKELRSLLEIFPGVLSDEHFVCPHCILTSAHDPTLICLEDALALEGDPDEAEFVCCGQDAEVPAALHYPRFADSTEHHALVRTYLEHQERSTVQKSQGVSNLLGDVNILAISKYICDESELYDLGVNLEIPLHQMRSIRTNQPQDINLAACEVLQVWKQNRLERGLTTQQMKEELCRVLRDMNKRDAEAELSKSHSVSKSSRKCKVKLYHRTCSY